MRYARAAHTGPRLGLIASPSLPIHQSLRLPPHQSFLIAPTPLFGSIVLATDANGTKLTTHPVAPTMVCPMAQTRAQRMTIAVSARRLPARRSLRLPTHLPPLIAPTLLIGSMVLETDANGTKLMTHLAAPNMVCSLQMRAWRKTIVVTA